MPQGFYLGITVFLGLCLGSLATALSWRIPRGINISVERSKCPKCGHALGVLDLVPFFSWIALRGRCRFCGSPIGWRYPLIELSTLAFCLAFYARFGFSSSTVVMYFLAPLLVAAADIDFAFKLLPDALNGAIFVLGVGLLTANAPLSSDAYDFIREEGLHALGGAALYALCAIALRTLVMAVLKKDPLGLGDIKFFGAAGFWLGSDPEVLSHFMLLSGLFGIAIALAWRRIHKDPEFPFGPALLAAFAVLLLWEPPPFLFQ